MNLTDTILITGGSGLAGTWLRKALEQMGFSRIFLLDVVRTGQGNKEYIGSVNDITFLRKALGDCKPSFIFHLAGLVGHKPLDEMLSVNVEGTRTLFDALCTHSLFATRVLITGSSAVYGDKGENPITEDMSLSPTSNYSISKVKQEEIALEYFNHQHIPVIISRAFNNIAPGEKEQMFISRIASQIARIEKGTGEKLTIGPLHSHRDYLDTRDVVAAYIRLMEKGVPGEIYNVCSGEPVRISDFFSFLIKSARLQIEYEVVAYDQKGNIPYQCGSPEKLKQLTGWEKQRDIQTTLLEILDYWRARV